MNKIKSNTYSVELHITTNVFGNLLSRMAVFNLWSYLLFIKKWNIHLAWYYLSGGETIFIELYLNWAFVVRTY